jgi:hypothetical protein
VSSALSEREQEALRAILLAIARGAPLVVNPVLAPATAVLIGGKVYFHGVVERDRFIAAFGIGAKR